MSTHEFTVENKEKTVFILLLCIVAPGMCLSARAMR